MYVYIYISVCVTNSLCIHTHAHKIWTNYVGDPTEVMEPRGNHPRSNSRYPKLRWYQFLVLNVGNIQESSNFRTFLIPNKYP